MGIAFCDGRRQKSILYRFSSTVTVHDYNFFIFIYSFWFGATSMWCSELTTDHVLLVEYGRSYGLHRMKSRSVTYTANILCAVLSLQSLTKYFLNIFTKRQLFTKFFIVPVSNKLFSSPPPKLSFLSPISPGGIPCTSSPA